MYDLWHKESLLNDQETLPDRHISVDVQKELENHNDEMGEEIKKYLLERMQKEFKKVKSEQQELFEKHAKITNSTINEMNSKFVTHRDNSTN